MRSFRNIVFQIW